MEIEILYDQSNIREVLERENFDTLSMEYYDRTHVDEKTGMTVYDYMSMMIRECREYVENFKNEKGKHPVYRKYRLWKDISEQLHRDEGADPKIFFCGLSRQRISFDILAGSRLQWRR